MHENTVTRRQSANFVQPTETIPAGPTESPDSGACGLRTISSGELPRPRRGWLKATGTSLAVGAAIIGTLVGITPKAEAQQLFQPTGRVMMDCRFYPCQPVPEMMRVPHPHGHGRVIVMEPHRRPDVVVVERERHPDVVVVERDRHPDVVVIERDRHPDVVVIERERRDPRDYERGVVTGVLGTILGCVLIGPCGH